MRNVNRLNEEIARWAFEIIFKTNVSWHIAFTNPTAGPWKTIKAQSLQSGEIGEVYRFILEEDRPDIIMYNDALRVLIIFEAKDSLKKLLNAKQAEKSAAVVVKLAEILRSKAMNQFWCGREHYHVVLGLLWGSSSVPETDAEKEELYDYYHSLIADKASVYSDLIVGVETLFSEGALKCAASCKNYNDAVYSLGREIIDSLMQ